MKRRAPVKRRNATRRATGFARACGSVRRVAWIKRRLCFAMLGNSTCAGPIENAHTVTGGMGRKGDASTIVPLCARHHRSLHQIGREPFERAYTVNLAHAAALTELAWQQHVAGEAQC